VGQSAIVGRARQALGRLSMTAGPWALVAEELVAQLRRVVGFDSFCVVQNDPRARLPAAAVSDNDCLGLRQRLLWQLEMRGPDVNKSAVLARAAWPVGVLSIAAGGDLARSARWRELLVPVGIGDELRAALVAGGRWWGSVSLYRERRSPWFTAEDAEAVGGLIGPSAAVARTAWTVAPGRAGAVPDAPGTLLVTADGQTVATTATADSWLARLPPAQRASGSLVQALTAHLAAAADRNLAPPAVQSLVRGADGSWIEFCASPLEPPVAGGDVAITIQQPLSSGITDLLLAAYTMTRREREVTGLAMAGRSTAEIGAELFLSPYTVADYLKGIFARTGVHSREELSRRLTGLTG
jgi:DNA-binding CsgD family transcriptional regulator